MSKASKEPTTSVNDATGRAEVVRKFMSRNRNNDTFVAPLVSQTVPLLLRHSKDSVSFEFIVYKLKYISFRITLIFVMVQQVL